MPSAIVQARLPGCWRWHEIVELLGERCGQGARARSSAMLACLRLAFVSSDGDPSGRR
jgi:hypothetical protein